MSARQWRLRARKADDSTAISDDSKHCRATSPPGIPVAHIQPAMVRNTSSARVYEVGLCSQLGNSSLATCTHSDSKAACAAETSEISYRESRLPLLRWSAAPAKRV